METIGNNTNLSLTLTIRFRKLSTSYLYFPFFFLEKKNHPNFDVLLRWQKAKTFFFLQRWKLDESIGKMRKNLYPIETRKRKVFQDKIMWTGDKTSWKGNLIYLCFLLLLFYYTTKSGKILNWKAKTLTYYFASGRKINRIHQKVN